MARNFAGSCDAAKLALYSLTVPLISTQPPYPAVSTSPKYVPAMLQTALATPRQRLTSPDAVPLHRPRCLARPEEGLLRYPRQALLALPLPRGALHSLALFLLMHLTDWCPRVPASVSLRSTMPDRYPLTVQQSNIPFNPLTKFFAVRYWTFMGEPLQQAG